MPVNTRPIHPALPRASGRFASPNRRLLLLTMLALAVMAIYMTLNLSGNLRYILLHRGQVLATLLLVAFASGVAALLFQTVTHNRILTPSIMGMESLFILIQTLALFFIDADALNSLGTVGKFVCESLLLVIFSVLLYRWLFASVGVDLHRVLLAGLVSGTLFNSLSSLMQRLLSPGEFAILQGRMFATFTRAAPEVLALAAAIVLVITLIIWRMRHQLDVLALGRDAAVSLGVCWRQKTLVLLILIAVLVAISTALVGPLTFFGLLVANLTWQLAGSHRHQYLLPVVVLTGIVTLVGGQLILERLLHMSGSLSVVIEFTGGGLFLYLLINKVRV